MAEPRRQRIGWAALLLTITWALLSTPARAATSTIVVGVRHNMRAIVVSPDGAGPFPAVLVLHTGGGLQQDDLVYATRLAKEGYVCLVPAYMEAYHIAGPPRPASAIARDFFDNAPAIYADLVDAVDTLRRDEKVGGRGVGAVGFSGGGYFAIWLAASGKVQAGVDYYGALDLAGVDPSLSRFRALFTGSSSPVLFLFGTADQSVRFIPHVRAILNAAHSPDEIHLYPGATHRFERDLSTESNRMAATDSWRRTLELLSKQLPPK